MIERIGETGLLLPELITRGLKANDRLNYYLTLLQTAQAHASAPHKPAKNLRVEREASGVADASLDEVVEASAERGRNTVYIPGAAAIVKSLFEELQNMLQPIRVAGRAQPELRARVDIYQRRLDDLTAHLPPCPGDQLTSSTISGLTELSQNGHDTLHRLVVDLHGELARLQTSVSIETIEGAFVYNLLDAERSLVRAFMRGVKETADLKFDHPGLNTSATHEGDRLTIENDLGLTPGHVVLIHVSGLTTTVTYTDVHRARVQFFRDLLEPYRVKWAAPAPTSADHEMSVGQYAGTCQEQLERYLTFLGSRLVFLIDWNRARKRLTRLISKTDALGLLKWAAENNVGHRAFLQAGGVHLIETAVARTAPLGAGLATRLDQWLGRDAARAFLVSVLRLTSSGLRARHSLSLIEDEVQAELIRHLQTTDRHSFGPAIDHAAIIAALADRLRRTVTGWPGDAGHREAGVAAELAGGWLTKADEVARGAARRLDHVADGHRLQPLLTEADAAVRALEETAFLLTLVPESLDRRVVSLLGELADLVGEAAREYVRCLTEGQELSLASASSDIDGFFVTIEHLGALCGRARSARRAITQELVRGSGDYRQLWLATIVAQRFEQAATGLRRCGSIVHDDILRVRLSR
jgi:hypothetical protein